MTSFPAVQLLFAQMKLNLNQGPFGGHHLGGEQYPPNIWNGAPHQKFIATSFPCLNKGQYHQVIAVGSPLEVCGVLVGSSMGPPKKIIETLHSTSRILVLRLSAGLGISLSGFLALGSGFRVALSADSQLRRPDPQKGNHTSPGKKQERKRTGELLCPVVVFFLKLGATLFPV